MNITVERIDTSGNLTNLNINMSRLAFSKHLALAGQGYSGRPEKLMRTIGMFFHYSNYMQRTAFSNDRFSEPIIGLSDPTEKGQFSNLAGKAIADFLSKKIDKSLFTVNYEAAMRLQNHKIKGNRPDLIAYTKSSSFAIEAKGRHDSNPGNMTDHKTQSQSGPISVNFTVACVSYNLFNQVKCNYHDPYNDNIPHDNRTLQALTQKYYSELSRYLDLKIFDYRTITIQNENFYEIELFRRFFRNRDIFSFSPLWYPEIFMDNRTRLILPENIFELAETGITNETNPFNFENEGNYIYIDNDRVGLSIDK